MSRKLAEKNGKQKKNGCVYCFVINLVDHLINHVTVLQGSSIVYKYKCLVFRLLSQALSQAYCSYYSGFSCRCPAHIPLQIPKIPVAHALSLVAATVFNSHLLVPRSKNALAQMIFLQQNVKLGPNLHH